MLHPSLKILAPAKISLFLHLTGKRVDGPYLLQSLTVFLDVGDELEFQPYDGLLIEADGPFAHQLTSPRENLIYKAALLLAEEYQVPARGQIVLHKNLPIASGIGGASSDAATALIGLAKLWRLPEETGRLHKIAAKLEADVPSCLVRRAIWAEGIGEKTTYLADMPEMHFVLANPMVPAPTAAVLQGFNARFSAPIQFTGRRKSMYEWIADLRLYRNDLTDAAAEICPPIRDVLRALLDTPSCRFSRLSGTGPTCFGVYESSDAALAAANKLRQQHPRWWIVASDIFR